MTLEGWSSPFVEAVTRTRFGSGGSMRMQPDGCWDVVVFRNGDTTSVLRTGLTTAAVTHNYAAGDEILAISFKPSSFMPLMPGEVMRDQGVVPPGVDAPDVYARARSGECVMAGDDWQAVYEDRLKDVVRPVALRDAAE